MEVFIIETDSVQSVQYRITYLKGLPDLKLNDKLYYSEKIISILEDGVCSKLCLRYKLMDIKPVFDEEFANAVRLLKRANQSNRPMVYEGIGGSYLDSFYDGLCPRSW
jgi:bacterioferritin (cytochrome b1)